MSSRAGPKTPKQTSKEPKDSKLPCSSSSDSEDMIDKSLRRLRASDALNLNLTPPLPPAEKFTTGSNYPRWELKARAYIRKFPRGKQKGSLLSLLAGDSVNRAFQANVFHSDDLNIMFVRLRELWDTALYFIEYPTQFLAARQNIGKTTEADTYCVRQLVAKAYPDDTTEGHDGRAIEQFIEGVANASLKKLITKQIGSFNETVQLARVTEKLQRIIQGRDAHCWTISQ
ncbi:unnamed protein product [Echinostoma caproni]|uniref:Retrotran_gag_3 domain-containing protein n=1 Tax=Echinostoma caproni TaxID=27848 RepID=A0A183AYX0_9TREM|nr:unnamed protein product [Echinostoma caproni]